LKPHTGDPTLTFRPTWRPPLRLVPCPRACLLRRPSSARRVSGWIGRVRPCDRGFRRGIRRPERARLRDFPRGRQDRPDRGGHRDL